MAFGFPDTRSPAEKAADLEVGQLRVERDRMLAEFERDGLDVTGAWRGYSEHLEDRLARVYRELYERGAG